MFSLSTQSLASCVNYFCLELFTVFFQHENRFRYKFFRYCSIFKVLCASTFRLKAFLFYHFRDKLSSTFLKFFKVSCRSFSILRVRTFVSKCFILSDVRLTVIHFSTGSDKKQAFLLHFLKERLAFYFFASFFLFFWKV